MPKHEASRMAGEGTFMTLLKRHRMARGFTQTKLARRLGVVPSTVSYWETGDKIPSPVMIPKLAKALALDPLELTKVIDPLPITAGTA